MPWIIDDLKFEKYYKDIINREQEFVGDISFYSLPYVNFYLSKAPTVRFVILKRDKESTIKSLLRKTEGRNHWMNHDGIEWRHCKWDDCFPKFDASSKEEALIMYYDYYYDICKNIPKENCFWISTDDLNNQSACIDMLNFCGFENPLFIPIKENRLLS